MDQGAPSVASAPSEPEDDQGREPGRLTSLWRALWAAGFAAIALVGGFWWLPSEPPTKDIPQPTITVYSSQPGITAVIAMSAYTAMYNPATDDSRIPQDAQERSCPVARKFQAQSASPSALATPPASGQPTPTPSASASASSPSSAGPGTPPARLFPSGTGTPVTHPSQSALAPTLPAYPPAADVPVRQHFDVSVKVISKLTRPVTFVLALNNFPAGATGDIEPVSILPVQAAHQQHVYRSGLRPAIGDNRPHHQSFLAFLTILPPQYLGMSYVTYGQSAGIDVITRHPMVSKRAGPDLQISYPLILPDSPAVSAGPTAAPAGPQLPVGACQALIFAGRLPAGTPGQLYTPVLKPGTTQFVAPAGVKLSDLQPIVGDPGAIGPVGTWTWSGVDDVSLVSQNVLNENSAQTHLFEGGAILGLAGAAIITAVVEAVSAVEDHRKRRRARKDQRTPPPPRAALGPADWPYDG
jgi:hypothetical protein